MGQFFYSFKILRRAVAAPALLALTVLITGCATPTGAAFNGEETVSAGGPVLIDHAFGFDARVDSPNVLILNYRYGTSKMPFTSGDSDIKEFGKSAQAGSIDGGMPIGDTLYVKWQLKETGEVLEDTVDLKPLLPRSMHRKRIYFAAQGKQLHVFLTDLTTPKPSGTPIVGPFRVQPHLTVQIYPTPPEISISSKTIENKNDEVFLKLKDFMINLSGERELLERRLSALLELPSVKIKSHGQTALPASQTSFVGTVYIDLPNSSEGSVGISIFLKNDICLTEDSWIELVNSTLTPQSLANNTRRKDTSETPWIEMSGGPHWPPNAVLRSRRLANGIGVSYRYFANDVPKCVNTPTFSLPHSRESVK